MKQIAEIIRNNDVDLLRRLIKASKTANRRDVSFLGKSYSIEDANQILLFMYNEEAKYREVHRDNKSLESDINSND